MKGVLFKGIAIHILTGFVISFMLVSCATKNNQLGRITKNETSNYSSSAIKQRFFLLGSAGDLSSADATENLQTLKKQFDATIPSSLLFLGDNLYPNGFIDTLQVPEALDKQIELAKEFPGRAYFIAGNKDWAGGNLGLKNQENYINDQYKDYSYYPKKNCAIDAVVLSDSLVVITIDSQWYLANWDKYPGINDNCYIRTREEFFDEFDNLINTYQNHTVLVAMHHPLYSNAKHEVNSLLTIIFFQLKMFRYPF